MARTRTTKKLAQRIDLNYFKRPTPLKRAKFWLSLVLPLLALLWIAWRGFSGDHRVYSSGRMSRAHAVFEKECAACHVQTAGAFSAKAADSACLDCHDGPAHHASRVPAPDCATCHTEHRGRVNISVASDQACAKCHKDLWKSVPEAMLSASGINSLQDGHPEFAAFRKDGPNYGRDLGGIKLNHAVHLKPIRRAPNGPNVQLQCGSCHHTAAAAPDLTYSDPSYRAATVTYKESTGLLPPELLHPPKPASGRELMVPVKFADACAGCHSLAFDKRFEVGVPHDEPRVVREFLQKKFQEYIDAHPGELRVARDPDRDLTGKRVLPEVRILTPAQWVNEQTAKAEELLWRKTCGQCHVVGYEFVEDHRTPEEITRWLRSALESKTSERPLPSVGYALTTVRWMPHAKFDHDAHRGFTCVSCHAKALTSTESSDILLPGIETCKTCHAPGPDHADSRCSECHTYHDWSKRKEITPKFTLPALRTGR
ncbi:MAG TPA: hypothetical protein VE263_02010 [Candidatus Angelobacter sp.]|nr:hypothetical protein [Candidatus Angelobacter sp.]